MKEMKHNIEAFNEENHKKFEELGEGIKEILRCIFSR
jgi:hypothetical protein